MTAQAIESEAHPVSGIPSPALKIIGAGFGRTGTLSLREALVRLGFGPCDHMLENLEHPERFTLWMDALRRKQAGEPIDWRPLLSGYQAIVDWPGAYFWRELIAAHPDARVILTTRDPERWYESCLATIFRMRARAEESLWARLRLWFVGLAIPELRHGFRAIDEIIWKKTFDGRFTDREHALRVFDEHMREVIETVPPEKLFVFDVKQGWEPLCAFLGVPVPEGEPFPHVNDRESMQQQMRGRMTHVALRGAGIAAGVIAGLVAFIWLVRHPGRREPAVG